jgi:flavin reductase (DIM6/NTAB) family NADH-FMN oxidoreductase RutF
MVDLDPTALRSAFGQYMTGVAVVTARSCDGVPVGFTANSFTSVSLDPPLLLVCPGKHLSSFEVFSQADCFAVNILADDQEQVSNLFASARVDRFNQVAWSDDHFGSPILQGVAAHFSCSTHDVVEAGDHIVLIGLVDTFASQPKKGLGYASSGYFNLGWRQEIAASSVSGRRAIAGAIVECEGQVLVCEVKGKLSLPTVHLDEPYGAPRAIQRHLAEAGLDVEIGQAYSVFDDAISGEHFTFYRAEAATVKDSSLGRFTAVEKLDAENMYLPAVSTMMRRFKSEFDNQQFGLFIGSSDLGDVRF